MTDNDYTSSELEQDIANQVMGEIPDEDTTEEDASKLAFALEALNDLLDIKDTISEHGVSQGDVQEVFDIVKKLNDDGIECSVGPALEEYGVKHFTPTRSIVNQTISQEGIGRAIVNAIKFVIDKLMSFVAGIVRRWKKFQANDKINLRKLNTAQKKSEKARELIVALNKLNSKDFSTQELKLIQYVEAQLRENALPLNRVTLAAFHIKPHVGTLKGIAESANKATMVLRRAVNELKLAVKSKQQPAMTASNFDEFKILDYAIDQLLEMSTDPLFIVSEIKPGAVLKFTLSNSPEQLMPFAYLQAAYFKIYDDLKTIKADNLEGMDDDTVRTVTELVEAMFIASQQLKKTVEFARYVQQTQMNLYAFQLKALNRYASTLYKHVIETTVHEGTRKRAEGVFKSVASELAALIG